MEILLFILSVFFVFRTLHWKDKARENEIVIQALRANERTLMKECQELRLKLEKASQDYWSK